MDPNLIEASQAFGYVSKTNPYLSLRGYYNSPSESTHETFFPKKKKRKDIRTGIRIVNRYKNFLYPNFLLLVLKSFLPIYRQTDRSVCENYPYRFVFSPPLFIKNNLETRHLAIHFYPNVELRFVFSQILKRPSRLL